MAFSEDISKSETLDKNFYFDNAIWQNVIDDVFIPTWHFIGHQPDIFDSSNNVYPFVLYERYLNEHLVLIKDQQDHIKCLSNVCTHRGFLLCHHPANLKMMTCAYHGRRFDLDGNMIHMPEFNKAKDFPRACDNLKNTQVEDWNGFLFTSISPKMDFGVIRKRLNERLYFLNFSKLKHDSRFDKIYNVNAHWALYCDNFLEGFHIPFVHNKLGGMIDYGQYTTEIYEYVNLQIGYTKGDIPYFELPHDHVDFGKRVTAYYYWIFPNFMLNVYPWGIQVNVVTPISKNFTKVFFYHYILDDILWEKMEAEDVAEKTQREDEWVVEGVQKGLQSRLYPNGRFSPDREQGVHHFHKLLQDFSQLSIKK
jgi:choline monooxygenase